METKEYVVLGFVFAMIFVGTLILFDHVVAMSEKGYFFVFMFAWVCWSHGAWVGSDITHDRQQALKEWEKSK